jgi:N-acetylneuraminic acid mutarotase
MKKYDSLSTQMILLMTAIAFLLTNIVLFPQLAISSGKEEAQTLQKGNGPSQRIYCSMIYHAKSKQILLFGGHTEHGWVADLRDIWAFDLADNSWENVGVYEASPMEGEAQSPAYDSESNRVIVLNSDGETWAYHHEERHREKMNPGEIPKTRAGHKMAYDSESDRVILFGGFGAKSERDPVYDETWAYDYNSNTWTRLAPTKTPPSMGIHAMDYSIHADKIIVFGGEVDRLYSSQILNETWIYDPIGNMWEKVSQ